MRLTEECFPLAHHGFDEDRAVTKKETIFTELNRLMDEQMKTLGNKLSREEAIEYAMRAERIEELLVIVNPPETGRASKNGDGKSGLRGKKESEG
jgi:hypothetical protein